MLKTVSFVLSFSVNVLVVSGNVATHVHSPQYDASADVLKTVFERLDSLELKLQQQTDDNTELQKTVLALQESNHQLRHQVNMLQTQGRECDNQMKHLKTLMEDFIACDQKRSDETTDITTYIKDLTGKHPDVNKRNKRQPERQKAGFNTERGVRRIQRREMEVNVAFFSTLSPHLHHLGANQNVVFDRIITNIGNAYSNHAGDFRAPVAGTYVFSVTLMAYGSHTTHYRIVQNSTVVANLYVRGAESPFASSSMTTVLQLKQGEDVSIRNADTDESLHGSSYSAFAGFLLYQDYSSPAIVGK